MPWFPAETYFPKVVGPVPTNHLLMQSSTGDLFVDSGISAAPSSGTLSVAMSFPPVGNPHVANQVYIDTSGIWWVSTG